MSPSGSPDHIRAIDIRLQGLAQMQSRSMYGNLLQSRGSTAALANGTKELISVSGVGVVYGGYIFLDAAASQKTDQPGFSADGGLQTFQDTFQNLFSMGHNNANNGLVQLSIYDDDNYVYGVLFNGPITFENAFILVYSEANGNTPTVKYCLMYATI